MKKDKMKCKNFDELINNKTKKYYIEINNIKECSYVKYIIIPTINGEIIKKPYIEENIKKIKKEIYYEDCKILAINILDNIIMEVI